MKKTLTANIGGRVFHIDEDAYDTLYAYLQAVKRRFDNSMGKDEIINDIELRIAELMQEKTSESKQVVTKADVEEIVKVMGAPETFESDNVGKEEPDEDKPKKLYRDDDDKVIAGVCSGIAAYFATDPVWIRVLFIVFLFAFSSSFWVYIILWVVIPKAKTTKEKLEMKGKKINISNIEESIREDLNDLKEKFNEFTGEAKASIKKNKSNLKTDRFRNFIFSVFKYFGKGVAVFVGLLLVFTGIFLIVGFLSSFFHIYNVPLDASAINISNISILSFLKVIFPSLLHIYMAIIGIILLIGVPLLMLIYNGFKLIFSFKYNSKFAGFAGFSLWLIGFVLCLITTFQVVKAFSHKALVTENIEAADIKRSTLYVDVSGYNDFLKYYESEGLQLGHVNYVNHDGRTLMYGKPEILFIQSRGNEKVEVMLLKSARGENRVIAEENTGSISYQVVQSDSSLVFPAYYFLRDNYWRSQNLKVVLNVPEAMQVHFSSDALKAISVN